MKKILLIIFLFLPIQLSAVEKTKEKKWPNMFWRIFKKIMWLVIVFIR
jgi:hypothetical protein